MVCIFRRGLGSVSLVLSLFPSIKSHSSFPLVLIHPNGILSLIVKRRYSSSDEGVPKGDSDIVTKSDDQTREDHIVYSTANTWRGAVADIKQNVSNAGTSNETNKSNSCPQYETADSKEGALNLRPTVSESNNEHRIESQNRFHSVTQYRDDAEK